MTTNPVAMNSVPALSVRLSTDRLTLHPTNSLDADRAFEIQSDWDVTRMLLRARFPPKLDETAAWFARHEQEWLSGKAYRFAIEIWDRMIGVATLTRSPAGRASSATGLKSRVGENDLHSKQRRLW